MKQAHCVSCLVLIMVCLPALGEDGQVTALVGGTVIDGTGGEPIPNATILIEDDRIEVSIKWQTPTFAYQGNIFSFNPAKNLISLLFHRGAEIPGDHPALEGEGKLARTMRFADLADVEARGDELRAAIQSWCELKDQ